MKHNVGGMDRWMRLGAGAALAGLYFGNVIPHNTWGKASLAVAGSLLTSGLAGYCPASHALGVDTTRKNGMSRAMHNL